MKKCSKLLSTILAVIMVLSTVSVSFVSFAAEAKEDVISSTVENIKNGEFDLFDVITKALGGVETSIDKINEKINEAKASNKTVAPKTETATPKIEAPAGRMAQIAPFAAADYPEGTEEKVLTFSNMLAAAKAPYTNAVWKEIFDFYTANGGYSGLEKKLNAADKAKYKEIKAFVKVEAPSTVTPDLTTYKQTLVVYPFGITNANVSDVLQGGETVLLEIADLLLRDQLGVPAGQTLAEYLQIKVFSGEVITFLLKAIYPLLAETIDFDTKDISDKITTEETNYAPAKAAIDAIPVDISNKESRIASFASLNLTSADFGFVDGDKEAFTNALLSTLRPLSELVIILGNPFLSKNDKNGFYQHGLFEDLIKIYEKLELDGVMSAVDYEKSLKAGETLSQKSDLLLKPVLTPIINLVEDFAASPVMVLLEKLPIICNAINSGALNEDVNALITHFSKGSLGGMITLPSVDLTTGAVCDMLNNALKDIAISETIKITIVLNKAKFAKTVAELAGCADAVQADSVSAFNLYRLGLNGRQGDAFVVLFRGICAQLKSSGNSKSVLKAIDNSDATRTEKFAAKVSVVAMSTLPTDLALYAIAG